jgi:IclR family acetate operon transcriptional repressor
MMRAIAGPGGRAPMHCSGLGKALLAVADAATLDKLLASMALHRETAHTLITSEDLRRDLDKVRAHGFAVDNEENVVGLRCVAAVIYDEHASPLAAISVSGPTARITEQRIPLLGEAVAGIAAEITGEIGGLRPN